MVNLSSFKVYSYPDGHKHVVSDKDLHGDTVLSASIHTFDDLFLIAQIKAIHPELTHLQINYLLAARCDRRFSPGEAIDLEIVCNYIDRLNFETVSILKPHNYSAVAKYLLFQERDATSRLLHRLEQEYGTPAGFYGKSLKNCCWVSPDKGSSVWINELPNAKHNTILQCDKVRDPNTGAIAVRLPPHNRKQITADAVLNGYDNYVIIDDLCDGGATFVAIAKAIKEKSPQAKVYLVVTHAIFSKGFEVFDGYIERIYCTDSFAKHEHPLVRQIEV